MTPRRDAIESALAGAFADLEREGRTPRPAALDGARRFWLGHGVEIFAVCALAAMSGLACRMLARPERPVTAFAYVYPFGETAGLRAWHLDGRGRWHERGPDGREARLFDTTARASVEGCRGSVTRASADPGFAFFVPDAGCPAMALSIRRGDAPWSTLGPMSSVSTAPARDP